jgi:MFS family permease
MEQILTESDAGRTLPAAAGPHGHREHLNRAWWGVVAVFLVHGLVVSTWVSRIAAVKSALGLGDGALGFALLGSAIGSLTAIPMSGWAVSKYGSRAAVQWTAAGFAFSLLLLAFAPTLPTLFAALVAYGAMAGANDVTINAQAVGVEKRLGRPMMSRFHAMFSLGGMIGAAAGALLATYGVPPALHLTAVAALVAGLITVTRPLLVETRERAEKPAGSALGRPPAALVALSAIGFCIFLSEGAIADWTAVYIREVLNAPEGLAAAGYAAFSAAMTLFRLAGDAITVRLGRAWTVRGGALVAACGLTAVVAADSPYTALAGFAAAGAGFSSIIPIVFAAGGRIPSVGEAAGVAAVSGVGYLGFLVGPPTIGFISELTSLRVGLCVLVGLSAAAAVLVSTVARGGRKGGNPLE